jgi:hypothetical protein
MVKQRGKRDLHSQFAFSGLISLSTSMVRLPWEVCRITLGSTPSSFPMLDAWSDTRLCKRMGF